MFGQGGYTGDTSFHMKGDIPLIFCTPNMDRSRSEASFPFTSSSILMKEQLPMGMIREFVCDEE